MDLLSKHFWEIFFRLLWYLYWFEISLIHSLKGLLLLYDPVEILRSRWIIKLVKQTKLPSIRITISSILCDIFILEYLFCELWIHIWYNGICSLQLFIPVWNICLYSDLLREILVNTFLLLNNEILY